MGTGYLPMDHYKTFTALDINSHTPLGTNNRLNRHIAYSDMMTGNDSSTQRFSYISYSCICAAIILFFSLFPLADCLIRVTKQVHIWFPVKSIILRQLLTFSLVQTRMKALIITKASTHTYMYAKRLACSASSVEGSESPSWAAVTVTMCYASCRKTSKPGMWKQCRGKCQECFWVAQRHQGPTGGPLSCHLQWLWMEGHRSGQRAQQTAAASWMRSFIRRAHFHLDPWQ